MQSDARQRWLALWRIQFGWPGVWGSRWFEGKGLAALALASSRHCFSPKGAGLEGHQSRCSVVCLKRENICVSVLLNSREKNWPTCGRRLDRAWMATVFGERIVNLCVEW